MAISIVDMKARLEARLDSSIELICQAAYANGDFSLRVVSAGRVVCWDITAEQARLRPTMFDHDVLRPLAAKINLEKMAVLVPNP